MLMKRDALSSCAQRGNSQFGARERERRRRRRRDETHVVVPLLPELDAVALAEVDPAVFWVVELVQEALSDLVDLGGPGRIARVRGHGGQGRLFDALGSEHGSV